MAIDYNRQYVGARYVPKFFENPDGSWDWAVGFQYEPLTMVKYGTNTYTSKQLVPDTIGTPNLNPQYWANTGDVSGSINNLQQRMVVVENETSENTSYIAKEIKKTGNRKFIFIGDSYAHASGSNNGWLDLLIPMLGIVYNVDYWAADNGGACFCNTANSFLMLLNSITVTSPNDITDIVVVGGANESGYSVSLIKSTIQTFITTATNLYPNAVVRIAFAGGNNNAANKVHMIEALCGYSSQKAQFIQNVSYSTSPNDSFQADGIHPTPAAYTRMANSIYGALLGGTENNYRVTTRNLGDVMEDINGAKMSSAATVVNDITCITFNDFSHQITFANPVSLAQNINFKIANLVGNIGNIGEHCALNYATQGFVLAFDSSNVSALIPVYYFASAKAIYFRPIRITTEQSAVASSVKNLVIYPFSITGFTQEIC